MTLDQSLWKALNHSFEQDIPATAQLLDLLEQERTALEERNYTTIKQLISGKQELLGQLENNASLRRKYFQDAGCTDEQSTLQLAQQQAPATAKAWQQLNHQWRRCQQLNEINERIAKRTRLVVGKVLDLLRGQQGQTRLYNEKGNTSPRGGSRTITSA